MHCAADNGSSGYDAVVGFRDGFWRDVGELVEEAADLVDLTRVILPRRNEADIDDVPKAIRVEMTFHIADNLDDILEWALG